MAAIGPPSVKHQGLLVPNAVYAASPRMAEPDQIDFATAANAQWGVVEGCFVTVSGTLATAGDGWVIIEGLLVKITGGSVPLGAAQSQDRFDLIVAKADGTVQKIDGLGAVDPVFPDVPKDATLLAAVFCPTTGSSYENNVIDKRRFISKALLTKVGDDAKLIQNANGDGDSYQVLGNGRTTWAKDTKAFRSDVATLRIENHLELPGNVTAGGTVQGATLKATGLTTGSNLLARTTAPDTAPLGAIWQNTALGEIKVMTDEGWKSLGFVADMVPPGTVILSMESVDNMVAKGWIPLDGREVLETTYPHLFQIDALVAASTVTGSAPERHMFLPDANGKMLQVTKDPTLVGKPGGRNRFRLNADQMPLHNHGVAVGYGGGTTSLKGTTGVAGGHSHDTTGGGHHTHDLLDPGHQHIGVDWNGNRVSLVALAWGGNNKIDALFNDRNHTYSVEAMDTIYRAATGITVINNATSEHNHVLSATPDHTHDVSMNEIGPHYHGVTEQDRGGNAEIDVTNAYIAMQAFIRS